MTPALVFQMTASLGDHLCITETLSLRPDDDNLTGIYSLSNRATTLILHIYNTKVTTFCQQKPKLNP